MWRLIKEVLHSSLPLAYFRLPDASLLLDTVNYFFISTSKDDSSTFEIWYSEKDRLPLRSIIGLSDQYGATIQVDLKKLPKL